MVAPLHQAESLLTSASCAGVIEHVFADFDVAKSTIAPIAAYPEDVGYTSYRIFFETTFPPLRLRTPAACQGGMQFAYMQKRFVYRFDNCVLSFALACDEKRSHQPWVSAGALYLAPTVDAAHDLISKLVQVLPLTLKGDGIGRELEHEILTAGQE